MHKKRSAIKDVWCVCVYDFFYYCQGESSSSSPIYFITNDDVLLYFNVFILCVCMCCAMRPAGNLYSHKPTYLSISFFDGLRLDGVPDFGANFDATPAATDAIAAVDANLFCDFDTDSM